ncbi:hypothetical protein [Actinobacillus succinogenes]|uniref:hypothetical protein n=1 Tax=Actinobacillus succinogenes TaxID=67854 RepID=UPI0012EA1874|nr:hypothetical protein [Actinobacillus succinogenes]
MKDKPPLICGKTIGFLFAILLRIAPPKAVGKANVQKAMFFVTALQEALPSTRK